MNLQTLQGLHNVSFPKFILLTLLPSPPTHPPQIFETPAKWSNSVASSKCLHGLLAMLSRLLLYLSTYAQSFRAHFKCSLSLLLFLIYTTRSVCAPVNFRCLVQTCFIYACVCVTSSPTHRHFRKCGDHE